MAAWCDDRANMPTGIMTKLVAVEPSGCWRWLRYISPSGYGRAERTTPAHRWVYQLLVGPIPEGHHVDHLCRNRACVNPAHLEPVTPAENNRRAALALTHCKRGGHKYTPKNTYVDKKGSRHCRVCQAAAQMRYKARLKATG